MNTILFLLGSAKSMGIDGFYIPCAFTAWQFVLEVVDSVSWTFALFSHGLGLCVEQLVLEFLPFTVVGLVLDHNLLQVV
jgi:hypothetical protein